MSSDGSKFTFKNEKQNEKKMANRVMHEIQDEKILQRGLLKVEACILLIQSNISGYIIHSSFVEHVSMPTEKKQQKKKLSRLNFIEFHFIPDKKTFYTHCAER